MGGLDRGSKVVGERGAYVVISPPKTIGVGSIYRGYEEGDKEHQVVLKTPHKGTDKDDLFRQRLTDEADILRGIDHPNIVKYVDRRPGKDFVLVLEYIEGNSFYEAFKGKPAPENEVRVYADRILDALQYIHSKNIVYRDLKPHNIIKHPSREVVILDFGAAKRGHLHGHGPRTFVGSRAWSAPEQLTTGEAAESSDIYALGTTLFFLLTGKEPMAFMRHDGSLMKGPRDVNPSVSRGFAEIVMRCVQSDPRLRPQNVEEVRGLLKRTYARSGAPSIIVEGRMYEVRTGLEIGRRHDCYCKTRRQLDVPIDEPNDHLGPFLERHHARITADRSGKCWLEDLGSQNRLAVYRRGQGWCVIPLRSRYELKDKDLVALAYSPRRGPYVTFTYNDMIPTSVDFKPREPPVADQSSDLEHLQPQEFIRRIKANPAELLELWGLPSKVTRKQADAAKAKFFARYPPNSNTELAQAVEDTLKKLEKSRISRAKTKVPSEPGKANLPILLSFNRTERGAEATAEAESGPPPERHIIYLRAVLGVSRTSEPQNSREKPRYFTSLALRIRPTHNPLLNLVSEQITQHLANEQAKGRFESFAEHRDQQTHDGLVEIVVDLFREQNVDWCEGFLKGVLASLGVSLLTQRQSPESRDPSSRRQDNKTCMRCGARIPSYAQFCRFCGAKCEQRTT